MKKIYILPLLLLLTGCSTPKNATQLSQTSQQTQIKDSKCLQKADAGKCRGMFSKYYFDTKKQKCQMFFWGGCEGNVPFETLQSCQNRCEK